jgi:peroxiredoxin Q/BCP
MDTAASHRRFRDTEKLPFDLLVDPDMKIARMYDVNVTNLLIVRIAERVTYLIGRDGIIQKAFEKVRPQGHSAEVLTCLLPPMKS